MKVRMALVCVGAEGRKDCHRRPLPDGDGMSFDSLGQRKVVLGMVHLQMLVASARYDRSSAGSSVPGLSTRRPCCGFSVVKTSRPHRREHTAVVMHAFLTEEQSV